MASRRLLTPASSCFSSSIQVSCIITHQHNESASACLYLLMRGLLPCENPDAVERPMNLPTYETHTTMSTMLGANKFAATKARRGAIYRALRRLQLESAQADFAPLWLRIYSPAAKPDNPELIYRN